MRFNPTLLLRKLADEFEQTYPVSGGRSLKPEEIFVKSKIASYLKGTIDNLSCELEPEADLAVIALRQVEVAKDHSYAATKENAKEAATQTDFVPELEPTSLTQEPIDPPDSLDVMESSSEPAAATSQSGTSASLYVPSSSPGPRRLHEAKKKGIVSMEYKVRAVAFWKSGKRKKLSWRNVRNSYKLVPSYQVLCKWGRQVQRSNVWEKYETVDRLLHERFAKAVADKQRIRVIDLRRWALQIARDNGLVRFKASSTWIFTFKRRYRICCRRITKENADDIATSGSVFVDSIAALIKEVGSSNVMNADESAFQYEMHTMRTLAYRGSKDVECISQSLNARKHSYTVFPLINASGQLMPKMGMCLQEKSDKFGPIVERTMFRAPNVFVMCSKSGLLSKKHVVEWLKEVYVPAATDMPGKKVLLLDSFGGHKDTEALRTVLPPDFDLDIHIIPPGTTSFVQPLDVCGFRPWKALVRRISDEILLDDDGDVVLHQRDTVIKLQSLVHYQLLSKRFEGMWVYAWTKAGYLDEPSPYFDYPLSYCFRSFGFSCSMCEKDKFIKCSWCAEFLCFEHFFHAHHMCDNFIA